MLGWSLFLAAVTTVRLSQAHTVITYPGWRGDNLHTNGTLPEDDPNALGITILPNGTATYPWGMQWMYPCGGLPQPENRTKWPVSGGALSVQPGWFQGHSKALIYVNIGIQEIGALAPPNMSHPVVPPFQITGPNNSEYGGQFCLPQVSMPVNVSLSVGQNITLQVVEAAQHGAALYSCVDLTLVDDGSPEVAEVTPDNCFNSTDLGFNLLFTSQSLTSDGTTSSASGLVPPTFITLLGLLVAAAIVLLQ